MVVFFFKQKTAYEMRISDWSSDVCSSDLAASGSGFAGKTRDESECLRRLTFCSHESQEGLQLHGACQCITLTVLHTKLSQEPSLFYVFYTLGNGLSIDCTRNIDDFGYQIRA